eukprot:2937410-Amphidinium_carterae.1
MTSDEDSPLNHPIRSLNPSFKRVSIKNPRIVNHAQNMSLELDNFYTKGTQHVIKATKVETTREMPSEVVHVVESVNCPNTKPASKPNAVAKQAGSLHNTECWHTSPPRQETPLEQLLTWERIAENLLFRPKRKDSMAPRHFASAAATQ